MLTLRAMQLPPPFRRSRARCSGRAALRGARVRSRSRPVAKKAPAAPARAAVRRAAGVRAPRSSRRGALGSSPTAGSATGRTTTGGSGGSGLDTLRARRDGCARRQRIGPVVRAGRAEAGMPAICGARGLRSRGNRRLRSRSESEGRGGDRRPPLRRGRGRTDRRRTRRGAATSKRTARVVIRASGDLAGIASRMEGLTLLRRMLYPTGSQVPGVRGANADGYRHDAQKGTAVAGEVAVPRRVHDCRDRRRRALPLVADRIVCASRSAIRSSRSRRAARALHRRRDARRARVPAHASLGRSHEIQTANTRARSRRSVRRLTRRRTAGPRITATTRDSATAALTQITPDNVHQLALAWAFQTGQTQQIKATPDSRQRRHLRDDTRQPLGDRRALGTADLALHAIRPTTRFHIGHRGVAVHGRLRVTSRRPTRIWSRSMRVDGQVSAGTSRSRTRSAATGRPTRRSSFAITSSSASSGDFDNLPGILQLVRPRDRRGAVDVLQHAAGRHAGLDQRRRHRRADVDDGHLRSRARICCTSAPATPRRC